MNDQARHLIFHGRVQGVGFRFTCHRIARHYTITGYVKNRPDGTVEMLMQGTVPDIDRCVQEIEAHFSGYIRDIHTTERDVDPAYTDFHIAY